jgi:hypothetical protein
MPPFRELARQLGGQQFHFLGQSPEAKRRKELFEDSGILMMKNKDDDIMPDD